MATYKFTNNDLTYPFEVKIMKAQTRISEWINRWGADKTFISFSGGKDSTVLLDLVRRIEPTIPAVYVNTGIEFPEIVEFVRSTPNIVEVRPQICKNCTIVINLKKYQIKY